MKLNNCVVYVLTMLVIVSCSSSSNLDSEIKLPVNLSILKYARVVQNDTRGGLDEIGLCYEINQKYDDVVASIGRDLPSNEWEYNEKPEVSTGQFILSSERKNYSKSFSITVKSGDWPDYKRKESYTTIIIVKYGK